MQTAHRRLAHLTAIVEVNGLTGSNRIGTTAAPPATIQTVIVSPTARLIPRIIAVEIPEPAAGITTKTNVCQRLANREYASRKLRGTQLNASSAILQTVEPP
jgi:hypothetical protein